MQSLHRRSFLRATALSGLGSMFIPNIHLRAQNPEKKLPNIVLFLVDDLGWMDIGCYGSKLYETPNVDRLATQGMRFTDAYSACTVCSPTRAARPSTAARSPRGWQPMPLRTAAP